MVMVLYRDLRCLPGGKKLCNKGVRQWAGENGLRFDDLHGEGIPEEDFLATGDHRAELVVSQARKRTAEENGSGQ